MEYSIWTGVLLLSSALGVSLMIDREPAEEHEEEVAEDEIASHSAHEAEPDIDGHRDTLAWFLDREDTLSDPLVHPETEEDDLALSLDDLEGTPIIEGFVPGQYQLELEYTPAHDAASGETLLPELGFTLSEDGTGSVILLDGQPVAEVAGVTGLTADNVVLVPSDEAAAGDQAAA